MIFDSIIEIFVRFGGVLYRWFEQYVINYFVNFGKGFVNFSTYDAAESYSQFYGALFGEQYRFRVTGSKLRRNYASNRIKKKKLRD
jgi:hypothetical protein